MAELEGGADAAAFASGLAAIGAVTELLQRGDHIVASDNLYGGTYRLLSTLTAWHGISTTFADTSRIEELAAACTRRTRLILIETPTNPLMPSVRRPPWPGSAECSWRWTTPS
ncbi:MAG: hypothetical protein GXP47_08325 [Acidobacteria bacterium]|nr:hypothetical protein [Acidobacteriota bacterium]